MAPKNNKVKQVEKFVEEKIRVDLLEKVMGDRFGQYAKYIIQDRAIPDVRDGLKPVQRRILYTMYNSGMTYDVPYRKSARVVGDVMGKFHPHGDSSIYEALVRMSQDWKINVSLIDMHGNNGSIDGDSAAAMRYTETRLSKAAMYLLEDIEKKTVPFVPNYDDSEVEPVILPSKFPNLLVNGADGISAGYATNIPPHNLHETLMLTIARINNPGLTVDEAMEILPGPDFPTGGYILDSSELRQAFETGRGRVIIRSKAEIVKNQIIITEIPYTVNKSLLVKRIDSIAQSKKIDGITEVRDESDKDGLRIVIDCKQEAKPDVILNYLYKNSDLQLNFTYNTVAIVDRSPKLLGVLDVIDAYILHEKEVIINRSNFDMDKAKKRLHIVEGFIKLADITNEVVDTIRHSKNKSDAKQNIQTLYGFTELQSEAIVTLQLYRLTNTDILEFQNEAKKLDAEIKKLSKILSSEQALKNVIIEELTKVDESIPSPRKSEFISAEGQVQINEDELIINEQCRVVCTRDGYIKRLSLKAYDQAIRAGATIGLKEDDYVIFDSIVNTKETMLLFTTEGSYINLPIYKIPEIKYKELGAYIGSLFDIGGEKLSNLYHLTEDLKKGTKALVSTKEGKVKLIECDEFFEKKYRKGTTIKLSDHDKVVNVSIESKNTEEVVVITKYGLILKYAKSEVPTLGNKAQGVRSIALKEKDEIVQSFLVPNYYKEELLLLTNRGALKRIMLKEIVRSKRGLRGTPYLKNVKTNPYFFMDAICCNPSKEKDTIEVDILTNERMIKYKGTEVPKDTYEHGAPITEGSERPIEIYLLINDIKEHDKIIKDLSSELEKEIKEVQEKHPNSLIDELGEIIEKQSTIYDFIGDIDSMDDEKLKEDLF